MGRLCGYFAPVHSEIIGHGDDLFDVHHPVSSFRSVTFP
jgi:hypothetical protein